MALPMTYSRRKRLREQDGKAAELRTHPIGRKLLQQLFMIFHEIDAELSTYGGPLFSAFVEYVRNEKGVLGLARADTVAEEFFAWWMSEGVFPDADHEYRLDVIELAFSVPFDQIRERAATEPHLQYSTADNIRKALLAINERMSEDGLGYRFQDKQLVALTSEFLHETAIVPALGLIAKPEYAAVDQEFRDALAEFRAGNYDDCIADCGNAFESALRVIASRKGWTVGPTDRAAALIGMAFDQQLVPKHLQSQFTGLRSVIQGVPTMRNNEGGHGSGTAPRVVDRHFAEYQLQQTAAAILFLINCAE